MHIKLKVLRGSSAGKEIGVKTPKFVIGRAEECNLRVNSEAISRQHCVISLEGEAVSIRDLGSRNGTFVNGERIEAPRRLVMGDQLRVGPLEFLVTFAQVAQASAGAVPAGRSGAVAEKDMAGLISDWLAEADETDRQVKAGDIETRVFRMDDTGRIPVASPALKDALAAKDEADAQSPANAAEAASEGAEQTGAEPEGGASSTSSAFGKKMPPKNAPPKDTQEAAAQTLRKLLNRGSN